MPSLPPQNTWTFYDDEAKALYINFHQPALAADDSKLTEDGILVRYQNDEIIGLTILNFSQSQNTWTFYDDEADALYINFHQPALAADDSELTEDGILVRYQNDEIIGLTILNFSQHNTESQDSQPQRPKKPELYFLKTYPFRYDSSHHHSHEQDYWNENVEIETSQGQTLTIMAYLLRVYPTTFNQYDAYMDIPKSCLSDIKTVKSPRLGKTWKVVVGPQESTINGYFRGDYTNNNPPAWIFGLRLLSQEQSG